MTKKIVSIFTLILGLAGSQIMLAMHRSPMYLFGRSVRSKRPGPANFSQTYNENSQFTGIVRPKKGERYDFNKKGKQGVKKFSKLRVLDLRGNGLKFLPAILLDKKKFPKLSEVSVDIDPRGNFKVPSKEEYPKFRLHCSFPNFTNDTTLVNSSYYFGDEDRELTHQNVTDDWTKICNIVNHATRKPLPGKHRMEFEITPLTVDDKSGGGHGHPIYNLVSLIYYRNSSDDNMAELLSNLVFYSLIESMLKHDPSLYRTINIFGDTVFLHFLRAQICVPEYWEANRLNEKDIFNLLIEKSNPTVQSSNGNTPLHWALLSWIRQTSCSSLVKHQIEALLKAGAQTNITNKVGVTPDMLLIMLNSSKSHHDSLGLHFQKSWSDFTGKAESEDEDSSESEILPSSQETNLVGQGEVTSTASSEIIDLDPTSVGKDFTPEQKAYNLGRFSLAFDVYERNVSKTDLQKGWNTIAKIIKEVPGKNHQIQYNPGIYDWEEEDAFQFPKAHPIFQWLFFDILNSCSWDADVEQLRDNFNLGGNLLKSMLENDPSIYKVRNISGDTPLLHYVRLQAEIKDFNDYDLSLSALHLLIKGSDLNDQSKNGNTALHWALLAWPKSGSVGDLTFFEQIKKLIKVGADLDKKNNAGITPRMLMKTMYPHLADGLLTQIKSEKVKK